MLRKWHRPFTKGKCASPSSITALDCIAATVNRKIDQAIGHYTQKLEKKTVVLEKVFATKAGRSQDLLSRLVRVWSCGLSGARLVNYISPQFS